MAKDVYHRARLIEVPQWIIDRASRADSSHCMIADAIKEAWPDATAVVVDLQTIRITVREAGKRYIYLTPPKCQQQLLRFDQGVKVEPWAFHIPVRPAQIVAIRRGSPDVPNKKQRPTGTGKKEIRCKHDSSQPTVHGGHTPPLAVLAHSSYGGNSHQGRKRIFGVRAAGTFDPTK